MKTRHKLGLLFAVMAAAWGNAPATDAQESLANWPQWRGPLANGVAPQGNPPVKWSEQENVQWKVACPGGGSASPVVWGDKIFVLAAESSDAPPPRTAGSERTVALLAAYQPDRPGGEGDSPRRGFGGPGGPGGFRRRGGGMGPPAKPTTAWKFEVLAFDRKTGRELWRETAVEKVPHEGFRQGDGGYACYSPVTDGQHVYAYFGSHGIYCYTVDGKRVWGRDLSPMNIVAQFGEGGSPALWGDLLIVNRDHEGQSEILALNKQTGETVWRMERDEPTSWSTPLVVDSQGTQLVVVNATNRVRAYDNKGKVVWECGGQTRNVIPSPVAAFGMVYVMSGFRGSALKAIQLGGEGDLTDSDAVKWTHDEATPYVPSPLLYDSNLYFFSGNNGILTCLDAHTGKDVFAESRIEGLSNVYASPVGAAGRVYLFGRDGKAVVLKQSSGLEVLATNSLDEGFDASPAVVGNQMFVRGKEHLYCLQEKGGQTAGQ